MTDQSHSNKANKAKKNKVVPPKLTPAHTPVQQDQEVPEAMQRMKDINYPSMKSTDFLSLQQGIGNKALQNLITQRAFWERMFHSRTSLKKVTSWMR